MDCNGSSYATRNYNYGFVEIHLIWNADDVNVIDGVNTNDNVNDDNVANENARANGEGTF